MAHDWLLGSRGQKILKSAHLFCVAVVLGGIASMLGLMLLKTNSKVGEHVFFIDWSIYQLFNTVVSVAFYGIVATALIFALFTKWGFFKHHWITVKWLGVAVLFGLVWFWIGPTINGTASLSDGNFHLTNPQEYHTYSGNSQVWIIVQGIIVLFLCGISIWKPWGIRKRDFPLNRKVIVLVMLIAGIAGGVNAFLTSQRLQRYRQMTIADTDLTRLADGVYPGEAKVGSYTYKVAVTLQNHRITGIQIVDNRKSPYARYAEGVAPKVLNAQNANVDTVTGATTTSKALLKAIENALMQNRSI